MKRSFLAKRSRTPAAAALAVFGLAAFCLTAPSARAQDAMLYSGTATVDASGTVLSSDANQNGFDPSFGGSDIPYNSVQVNGGTFQLGDGGSVTGAFTDSFGNSYAVETTGSGTAAINGGSVNYDVYAYDTSAVGLSGGVITGNINCFDGSTADLSGGVVNGSLYAYSTSAVTVTGGALNGGNADGAFTFDNSLVNISGGTVAGLDTNGSSQVNIFGGSVTGDGVNALDTSTVDVTGGSLAGLDALSGTINFAGGSESGTLITQGGVLDLFGQFAGYSTGDTITSGRGSFTGTLLYGGTQTFQYDATQGGVIEFNGGSAPINPVPESSSAISLALGLLCLSLLAYRLKHRTV